LHRNLNRLAIDDLKLEGMGKITIAAENRISVLHAICQQRVVSVGLSVSVQDKSKVKLTP
jgi:hypothetical protein